MKKVLFALMLVIMGNTFTATVSRNLKTAARVSENERKEMENAIQKEIQPFVHFVMNAGISEARKQLSEEAFDKLFGKDYVISNSLKNEITEKYIDEIVKFTLKGVEPRVVIKKIDYVSQNEVQVNYDIKIKNLEKFWDILELDDGTERKIIKKMGIKNEDEIERVMKNKGNDELKRKYYYIFLEEMVNFINEKAKGFKEEETLLEDMSVTVKKVNNKWKIENLENNFN
ncbi:hypothetical protein [Leptotrichia buccalis]|jgi:hypothetical protein|uniref:DUF5105 domain-containing protein n=1 Tax=Leptotrichia buccalis (strain ATCC 14201 / DSM 1135 / JCM 12969 / NCTC 10249 / C-1013-b) TaxID=523794 RepID=C7NCX2_LEPBD|nr:hypothetical protein [Leptotrichia buccalis]ACV38042.1 hypothetical protein Lebu_0112 [Leptotrichia buccalis C-1013-b]